jgi:threonine/homoserine/homoserine lactone efflux protein
MPVSIATGLAVLFSGITFGLYAVVSPGPFQAYLISQTLKNGWKKTIAAIFAPVISDGPIILLMVFILTRLPEAVLTSIQVAGGLLLLALAWRAFQDYRRHKITAVFDEQASNQNVWEAALVNASSPGPWLSWSLVTGPLLLNAWRTNPLLGLTFLAGFYGTMLIGLAAFIIVLGSARRLSAHFNRNLLGLSAVLLGLFGLYQIFSGIGRYF